MTNTVKTIEESIARRLRVMALMKAIAGLRAGGLEIVLDLDKCAPLEDEGPAILDTNQALTGTDLADLLEDRLRTLQAIGRSVGLYDDLVELR
jgi:hypothetical protein